MEKLIVSTKYSSNKTLKQFVTIILVFCYVFSFTVIGPITSSLLIGFLFSFKLLDSKYRYNLKLIINQPYSKSLIRFFCILFVLTLFYPLAHLSLDYYFSKIIFILFVQFIIGCFLWSYLITLQIVNHSYNIYKAIIWAFVIQSIIQCVVSFNPSLLPIIYHFNNAQEINENYTAMFGTGVRGVAMANGTGFSLSLGYGIVFILYIHYILSFKFTKKNLITGILIFIGMFFAGRSGFLSVGIGIIYYIISPFGGTLPSKLKNILKVLIYIIIVLLLVYIALHDFVDHIINNVLPFAFEPIYNFINGGKIESASTNRLGEMWQTPVSLKEILLGAGCYFEPGHDYYYKRTDIGIFKNIFFWGVGGYILVIVFQYLQLFPLRQKNIKTDDKLFFLAIFCFLFLLDFKAIALSLNKTAFSVILLIVLQYETNSFHYSFPSFKHRSWC